MTTYTTNPQAIHETIDGETIIIDLASGTYFSLQGAGTEIWNGLKAGESAEAIVARLARTYSGDPVDIVSETRAFLRDLETGGLVTSSNGATAEIAAPASAEGTEPFARPKIEKYTDMQDIILLDPVHQVDERGWPHAQAETA
jgi:Coenzyme PQQ synthesis protein D (PqqD)